MDSELQKTIDLVGTLTIDDVGGPLTAERIAILVEAARKWAILQDLVSSGEAGRIIVHAGIKAQEPVAHWPMWRDDLLLDLGIIDKLEIGYAKEAPDGQ